MTCVAGLIDDNGTVWMAGDSAGASGWSLQVRADSKVFRRGPMLMGFTTSFRMGQLLRYSLDVPEPPSAAGDLLEWMATSFVDAVRRCLKDGGFATKDKDQEEGGEFLVGIKGHLFTVHSDYQVSEQVVPYAAVGCGADLARGALHATGRVPDGSPLGAQERLGVALSAAEAHSAGVRAPFFVETLACP